MITKEIQRAANSYARSRGYGKATEIRFAPISRPRIVEAAHWCFCTRGGTKINHPSAYSSKGWSNMVYWPAYCIVMMPHPMEGEH